MSNSDPRSWLSKALGACLSLLSCALALYFAAKLIEAVAVVLLIIVGAATLATGVFTWLRTRHRQW